MSKHTPGPWFVADWTCFDGDNLLTVEAREPEITEAGQSGIWPDGIRKRKVASTDGGSFDRPTNLANAHLIAAAPEMYELLQTVARTWEDDCQFIPCDTEAASALSGRLARLAGRAAALLATMEGTK